MVRQYPLNRWVSGTYKRSCDRCGWDYLRSELRREWNGAIVCFKDFDPRPRSSKPKKPHRERPVKIEVMES